MPGTTLPPSDVASDIPEWDDDPRFATVPPMADDSEETAITDEVARRNNALYQRRHVARRKEAERRLVLVSSPIALEAAGLDPAKSYSRNEVADYYRVDARNGLWQLLKKHGADIEAAGWDQQADAFSAGAVAFIGLIMRGYANPVAASMQQSLDPAPVRITFGGTAMHRTRCAGIAADAAEVAADLREIDPAEVWSRVHGLDPYRKSALVIALAAMVLHDHPGTRAWLKAQDPNGHTHPLGGGVAEGLATLIATPETADGKTVGQLTAITDALVGL
jgi:hypothetical protein